MRPEAALRWLWSSRDFAARALRSSLLPAAGLYAATVRAREQAYRHRWLARDRLPVPVVSVGNLSLGGTGKTPMASWIARWCARHGCRPGIVLSGYAPDEVALHRELCPGAVVVAGRDRPAQARAAISQGADVVVVDDGYQRLDLEPDLNLLLLAAEAVAESPWPLPAGPWREPLGAARRADLVVITRKCASRVQALELAAALHHRRLVPSGRMGLAHLRLAWLGELWGRERVALGRLEGSRVLAVCAIAAPETFARQLAEAGARVELAAWRDHHSYTPAEIERLLSAAGTFDYVITTHKDAVKLRMGWPAAGPRLWVAHLALVWEAGEPLIVDALSDLLASR